MGPIGYLARIAVAAVLGWFTYVLVAPVGPDGFGEANFTAYWYLWTTLLVFDVLGVYTFGRNFGGGPPGPGVTTSRARVRGRFRVVCHGHPV